MRKYRRLLAVILAVLSLTVVSGCGGQSVPENTADNSFYSRSEVAEDELGEGYKSKVDKIYENAYERFTDPDGGEEMEGDDIFDKILRKFLSAYHRAYRVFRTLSPYIGVCSFAIGVLMYFLSRENKKIQHTGLYVFMIGIPVFLFVVVFGIGIANGVFLY